MRPGLSVIVFEEITTKESVEISVYYTRDGKGLRSKDKNWVRSQSRITKGNLVDISTDRQETSSEY